jgi:Uma2 family endonuclease
MTAVLHLPEQKVILQGVSWETYERLLAEHEEESGSRFAYDSGILEILVPSARHEKPNHLLASLVEVLAEEMGLNIECLGSTTLKRPALLKGFEPDSCFYIQHAEAIRDNEEIDLTVAPHLISSLRLISRARRWTHSPSMQQLGCRKSGAMMEHTSRCTASLMSTT